MRNTTRIHTTLSSSATTPARVNGTTRVALFGLAGSTALCPLYIARPQLEFRPGISLFARRYLGNLFLISFPRLTDMLKFGLYSRTAQVIFLLITFFPIFFRDIETNTVPYADLRP